MKIHQIRAAIPEIRADYDQGYTDQAWQDAHDVQLDLLTQHAPNARSLNELYRLLLLQASIVSAIPDPQGQDALREAAEPYLQDLPTFRSPPPATFNGEKVYSYDDNYVIIKIRGGRSWDKAPIAEKRSNPMYGYRYADEDEDEDFDGLQAVIDIMAEMGRTPFRGGNDWSVEAFKIGTMPGGEPQWLIYDEEGYGWQLATRYIYVDTDEDTGLSIFEDDLGNVVDLPEGYEEYERDINDVVIFLEEYGDPESDEEAREIAEDAIRIRAEVDPAF